MYKDYYIAAKVKRLIDYPSTTYLCIHSLSPNNNQVSIEHTNSSNTPYPNIALEYSRNAEDWYAYTPGTKITLTIIHDHVFFKAADAGRNWNNINYYDLVSIVADDIYAVSGKISSILDPDITKTNIQVPETWRSLFKGYYYTYDSETDQYVLNQKDNLEVAEYLQLNAVPSWTDLSNRTYNDLFSNCKKLKKAPDLSNVPLVPHVFDSMFEECTKLYQAPNLANANIPVNAAECYHNMFKNCTNLATLPKLPSWTIAEQPSGANVDEMFDHMFYGCSKIKFSTTQNDEYKYQYNIPPVANYDDYNVYDSMIDETGGTYQDELPYEIDGQTVWPIVLYTSNAIIPADNN